MASLMAICEKQIQTFHLISQSSRTLLNCGLASLFLQECGNTCPCPLRPSDKSLLEKCKILYYCPTLYLHGCLAHRLHEVNKIISTRKCPHWALCQIHQPVQLRINKIEMASGSTRISPFQHSLNFCQHFCKPARQYFTHQVVLEIEDVRVKNIIIPWHWDPQKLQLPLAQPLELTLKAATCLIFMLSENICEVWG